MKLSGRLSRLQHLYALLILFFGGYALFFTLSWGLAMLFKLLGFSQDSIDATVVFLLFLFFILLIIETLVIHGKRLHDQGRSGRDLLFMFVPIMNLLLLYWIWFASGDLGGNKYGKRIDTKLKNLFGFQ